jgi:hypothetical protein
MLRATPNINVFRPADIIETAEAWELALETTDRPTVLVLSRQGLPMLRSGHSKQNRSARGAYVLHEPRAGATSRCWRPDRKSKSPSLRPTGCWPKRTSRPPSFPCRLGTVRSAGRSLSQRRARQGAAHRHRGGIAARLGSLDRRQRRLHRHEEFRCQRAGRRSLPPFRHHHRCRHRRGCPADGRGGA